MRAEYIKELKEKEYSSRTVYDYQKMLNYFEQHGFNSDSLTKYQRSLKGVRPITKSGYLFRLRRYLREYHPELVHEVVFPRVPERLPKDIPSQDEVNEILNMPDISSFGGIRDRAILELLYSTGMRRAELANLRIEDIDTTKQLVRIIQGKNRKDRVVPISKKSLKWIDKYVKRVRPYNEPKTNHLFISRTGFGYHAQSIYYLVKKYSVNGCHKYRHAYATHLLENGMKETSLQRLLGHSQVTTTQVYTKVTVNHLRASYEKYHPRDRWK